MAAELEEVGEAPASGGLRKGNAWRNAGGRFGWGFADQAVSSVTNFAVNIYIVHRLGAVQYGAFALAYVTYAFVLQASRGLTTDPLLVRFSGKDLPTWRRAVSICSGTSLLTGLVAGAGSVSPSAKRAILVGPCNRRATASTPALMLQDNWRYAFFALGRGSRALVNDIVWAVGMVVALLLMRMAGLASVFWFVFAWGAASGLGAALGPLQARVMPKLSGAREWLSEHRDLGTRYLVEGTSYNAAGLLRNYGIGLILGLAALGYIQAANTLMGPVQVVWYGMGLVAIPEAVRIMNRSPRHLPLFCAMMSVGLTALALGWGVAVLVALPRGLGVHLLGPIWRSTYPLVFPTTLFFMGACASTGPATYMHAIGNAKRSMRAAVLTSIGLLVGSLIGAHEGGALGAMRGAAIASWTGTLIYWWQLRVALHELRGAPASDKLSPNIEHVPMLTPGEEMYQIDGADDLLEVRLNDAAS
jgi:O-antigen/teichoic acid export membrane protein